MAFKYSLRVDTFFIAININIYRFERIISLFGGWVKAEKVKLCLTLYDYSLLTVTFTIKLTNTRHSDAFIY
jgi:hypothetical protein